LILTAEHTYGLVSVVFFFQAEDGIRGFHVTGVQTCALPIFVRSMSTITDTARQGAEKVHLISDSAREQRKGSEAMVRAMEEISRSEERRVGKECRSRRALYQ